MSEAAGPLTIDDFLKLVTAYGKACTEHGGAMEAAGPKGQPYPKASEETMLAAHRALLTAVAPLLQKCTPYSGGMRLVDVMLRLRKIAEVNGEQFFGRMAFTLERGTPGSVEFEETAEGHHFFGVVFQDKNQIYQLWTSATEEGLQNACKAWSYKYPPPAEKEKPE